MTTEEAVHHFGGVHRLSRALSVWPQAVYKWGEYPPRSKQFEIQVITGEELKVEEALWDGTTHKSN